MYTRTRYRLGNISEGVVSFVEKYQETALIQLIIVGLVLGILVAVFAPQAVPAVAILGDLFVRALKGVAPLLVFILVMNAMAQKTEDAGAQMRPIVKLYIFATFFASVVAVGYSFAAEHDMPCYDAGVVPYPKRMREYGQRAKRADRT